MAECISWWLVKLKCYIGKHFEAFSVEKTVNKIERTAVKGHHLKEPLRYINSV